MNGVDADIATLHMALVDGGDSRDNKAALARVEAELSRLREQRDEQDWRTLEIVTKQAQAAEARCARLQQALEEREDERLQLRAAFNRLQDQILEASVPGSSAADVDGAEKRESAARGHHESVGERQGRQPGTEALAGPDTPAYDRTKHEWVGQCPHGDVCSGCDARGYCTREEDTPADSQEPRDESGYPGLQGLEALATPAEEEA